MPADPGSQSSGMEVDSSDAWAGEPQTLDELNNRYDTVMSCPGRNAASVELRSVPAIEKGKSEADEIATGQQHKLFMASRPIRAPLFYSSQPKPQAPT